MNDMGFYNNGTIVPFVLRDKDPIKNLKVVADNVAYTLSRGELNECFRKFAGLKSASLSASRLEWYLKYRLIELVRPAVYDTDHRAYHFFKIRRDKVNQLYKLLEPIDFYGFSNLEKALLHICAVYDRNPSLKGQWINTDCIMEMVENGGMVLTSNYKGITFSQTVSSEASPLDRAYAQGSNRTLVYKPNKKAGAYLDAWQKVRDWTVLNEITRPINVVTSKGIKPMLAVWAN